MQKKVDASRGLCAKIRVLHFGKVFVLAAPNGTSISAKVRKEFLTGEPQDYPKPAPLPQGGGRKPFSLEKLRARCSDWREKMVEWAKDGRGQTKILCEFDLDDAAFENLLRDEIEFREHYKRCLMLQKLALEERGLDNLENRNFNHNLWQMFMVNWFNYKTANSKNEIRGDLNVEKTEKIENLTNEQIETELKKRGFENAKLFDK